MSEYKYRVASTGGNSSSYGNCECCDNPVSEVFHQVEERKYFNPISQKESYTHHNCRDYFGHRDCLEDQQR